MESDDRLQYSYNRILDITAAIGIPIKLLSMYLIIFKSPRSMRHTSYFILNEVSWNCAGNLLFAFGHPLPLMPALCFRMDGLFGYLPTNDEQRKIFFMAALLTVVNCAIGLMTTFQFRYMTLAFKNTISNIHPAWGYVYCITLHLIGSAALCYLLYEWRMPTENYSKHDLPNDLSNIFCYSPDGAIINIFYWVLTLSVVFVITLIIVFSLLCTYELKKQKRYIQPRTLAIQRLLLRNLVIMTTVPIVQGGLPLLGAIFFIYNSELPYAKVIVTGCIMMILNYGTVYGILMMYLFKSYRRAVHQMCRLLLKPMGKCGEIVSPVHTSLNAITPRIVKF
ncbi:hypothetical protein QR680_010196 [Steinernema hermaphroditum]|uniref:Uncharacterized protein n=1 Tax=Steinernema hermaphroditum TaxID=289476 RepID=A0AA39IQK3_9BILA|nr:hypothetical protein QR680_010196 [Steinernema hermaphroditum]